MNFRKFAAKTGNFFILQNIKKGGNNRLFFVLRRFTLKNQVKNLRHLPNPREINLLKLFLPKISAKIRASYFHPNLISPNLKVFPRRNLNFENQIHFLEFR
jgi:hypothetical protein